jgi:hypothetical protein
MLLLDEPTNHLDAETIAWLQQHLIDYKGTILCVTHDRYFLDDITGWILELDRGRGIPYEGNYSAWVEQKAKRLEQEAREDKAKQKTLARELEWMRQGAQGPAGQAEGPYLALQRPRRPAERERVGKAQIVIPNGPRLGGKVIEVENLRKAMGDKLLIENLSFSIPPGGHRRRDRPERRRQDDALPDADRAGETRRGHGRIRRHGEAQLRRPVPRRPEPQRQRLGSDLGRAGHHRDRRRRGELPRLLRGVQLQGRRPAEEGEPAVGR